MFTILVNITFYLSLSKQRKVGNIASILKDFNNEPIQVVMYKLSLIQSKTKNNY